MLTTDALPNNMEALKALVLAHAQREQQIQATVQQLELIIASHCGEIARLKLLIAKLQRMQFGLLLTLCSRPLRAPTRSDFSTATG